MGADIATRVGTKVADLAKQGMDWLAFAAAADDLVSQHIDFDRSCWHAVDPGTVMFTGSLNQNIGCSGTWLAHHEYEIDDVNQWWFLARSGRLAGANSIATHGDLSRSARFRTHGAIGVGDELRASLVLDGTYLGAVGLLRDEGKPWFSANEVRLLHALSPLLGEGFRRALLAPPAAAAVEPEDVPGVVIFDPRGEPESVSPAADHWVGELLESPLPRTAVQSRVVELVAARARSRPDGADPLGIAARARVRTRSGRWLLIYGTQLSGTETGRVAVIIQPAPRSEVIPIIALAYGLTEREQEVSRLCLQGLATKAIATSLGLSQYTVQDHLKAIFAKTGARSRGELTGQIFLEHYVPRWEPFADPPAGWLGFTTHEGGGRVT